MDKIEAAIRAANVNLDDADEELLTGLFSRLSAWIKHEKKLSVYCVSDKHMCALLRNEGKKILNKESFTCGQSGLPDSGKRLLTTAPRSRALASFNEANISR